MSRSLFTFFCVMTISLVTTHAHADLDSLLGAWTQEASADQAAGESLVLNNASEPSLQVQHVPSPEELFPSQPVATVNPYAVTPGSIDCGGCDSAGPCQQPACKTCGPKFKWAKRFGSGCDSCGELVEPGCQSCKSCGLGGKLKGLGSKGCNTCGEIVEGCQSGCNVGLSECRPHRAPTLPPPSSMLEYFRSRPSYSGIWAGYAEETRNRCRNKSPHVLGTCDCLGCRTGGYQSGNCATGSCGPVSPTACGCGSCGH
ncbi:putative signal peptide protein [Rhodopirellula islandica]|uniref:Signal peptide protein n=1 Tax=Rhodopirellula islandica TaxID=595434 RepID=A0A0J1EDE3_RHOIS|nr:hypothetical protein [Rhodopirellula islandica]KLU03574.1 putative signal peptide protein [Rhodopirellula islandica]